MTESLLALLRLRTNTNRKKGPDKGSPENGESTNNKKSRSLVYQLNTYCAVFGDLPETAITYVFINDNVNGSECYGLKSVRALKSNYQAI